MSGTAHSACGKCVRWIRAHKELLLGGAIAILAFGGFLDATFLTFHHYSSAKIGCPLFGGCDRVLQSKYATIGDVPISLFGAGYYLVLLVLAVIYLERRIPRLIFGIAGLAGVALLASLYLVYLQAFVLRAFCFYCMTSFTLTSLIALLSIPWAVLLGRRAKR